jgi:magnesium transporter
MITIYKTIGEKLDTISEPTSGCWVCVTDPTLDEIDRIVNFGIPHDYITYSLDVDESSRTEREDDGVTLILLRIPYFHGKKMDVPYTTIPMGIILTQNMIITVCRWNNIILDEFTLGKIRGLTTTKRNRFILRVLLATAIKYLGYLREINKTVDQIEDQLQASMRNKEVMELLKYQKSLVYFTTSLKSNELMLERLQRSQIFRMFPEDEELLEDVITENRQAIEMTNVSRDILTSMMDAFASIISNNLNVVMKFLASITIVLSIPTIVTSFFGMNVPLPFAENPFATLYIIIIFITLCIGVVVIFIRRDWF